MKKIFTLTLLLVIAMTVNAQETYRKSWDFTKWSATTIANFMADPNWTDDEKGDNYASKAATGQNCRWEIKATPSEDGYVQANGSVIEELKGLTYISPSTNRGLAIATDYSDCTARDGSGFGPYNGAAYLWLCGKNTNYFVIPHVALGTTIKMGIESHKLSSARGVTLYIGENNNGTALADPVDANGNAVSGGNVTNYTDLTWTVPENETATNDDGTVNLCVRCNSGGGMHIYYITVGDGDTPQQEEAKKAAYFYGADWDSDNDMAYILGASSSLEFTPIDITSDFSAESLQDYDALVISPSVQDASKLKSLIAFFPIVNLSANSYASLGYGQAVATEATALTIADNTSAIFEGYEGSIEYAGAITGVQLKEGSYFSNDAILAKAGDVTAIHVHNPGRNAYYLVPAENASEDVYMTLIPQTILAAAKTKKAIAAVSTPVISMKQEDGQTIVTITAAKASEIVYTLDGSDPKDMLNANRKVYAEPFSVTEACTVKAYATGDGFTDSEVAEKDITISHRAVAPTFSINREAGKSTISINGQEGTKIYFNFNGATTAALSQLYTEPIEMTEPVSIYALAEGEGLLTSDLAMQYVGINGIDNTNIRLDTLAHFDANQTDWYINNAELLPDASGKASAYYFWGKSAWNYYTSEEDHREIVKDELGNPIKSQINPEEDSVIVYYKPDPNALRVIMPLNANGWMLKSSGQVLTGELQLAPEAGVGNGNTGRFAEEAIDLITTPSKGVITFGGKVSGEPYTASIETTEPLQAPFDIIVMCGNGNGSGAANMEVQVSADGQTWTKVGDVKMAGTQRYFKRTRLSYNEEGEVYVRVAQVSGATKAQVYDIFIMNNGEESKKYATGISEVNSQQKAKTVGIYSINGVRRQQLRSGLNIVVGADGNVRKVMVK